MRTMLAAALAAATLPIAATAQVIYEGPSLSNPPRAYSSSCMERDARLLDRGQWLDSRKRELDRDSATLAEDLRRVDNRDLAAVAAYNARSSEHNRKVAELNASVAQYNADMQLLVGDCSYGYVAPRRGDVIIWERSVR